MYIFGKVVSCKESLEILLSPLLFTLSCFFLLPSHLQATISSGYPFGFSFDASLPALQNTIHL